MINLINIEEIKRENIMATAHNIVKKATGELFSKTESYGERLSKALKMVWKAFKEHNQSKCSSKSNLEPIFTFRVEAPRGKEELSYIKFFGFENGKVIKRELPTTIEKSSDSNTIYKEIDAFFSSGSLIETCSHINGQQVIKHYFIDGKEVKELNIGKYKRFIKDVTKFMRGNIDSNKFLKAYGA